jgi:hypothetical protein
VRGTVRGGLRGRHWACMWGMRLRLPGSGDGRQR